MPEQWDPVSKQPAFKSGAVRIEKCVQKEGQEETQAKEQQTAAIHSVETQKRNTTDTEQAESSQSGRPRVRRLELWLGATIEALDMLVDVYDHLVPRLIHDFDVHSGLLVMHRITTDIIKQLKPQVDKYHESQQFGRSVAQRLRDTIFPSEIRHGDPYEALAALQSLQLFLTYIDDHLVALLPASEAIWDTEFVEAVMFAQASIARQKAWAAQHIKVKSPQTLLVPLAMPEDLTVPDSSLAGTLRS